MLKSLDDAGRKCWATKLDHFCVNMDSVSCVLVRVLVMSMPLSECLNIELLTIVH